MNPITTARPLLLAVVLLSCGEAPDPFQPIPGLPRELTVEERAVVSANNAFTIELFRALSASDAAANVFVSPFSASMALGMALNGAEGATFDAMRATLRFGALPLEDVNASYRGLTDVLLGLDPKVDMRVANSVWLRQGFPIEPAFVEASATWFDATARELDFGAPEAVESINAWVDAGTNGRIPELLEWISPDEIAFLINATYFKASWSTRFDPARTAQAPFHRADGSTVQVAMMSQKARARFTSGPGYALAELPYGGDAFGMIVLVPYGDASLESVIADLTPGAWTSMLAALHEVEDADIAIPRFRLEYETELKDALTSLGMGIAFEEWNADFSRMSADAQLFLTRVTQKTFLEVNEEGTEAAAATSVGVGVVSAPPGIRADRPFLIAIRERFSGAVLFMGRIGDPR